MTQIRTHRRGFIAGAAMTSGLLSLAGPALAGRRSFTVIADPADPVSDRFARAVQAAGGLRRDLGEDPVRLWRDQLRPPANSPRRAPLVGLTGWNAFLVLQGCAAEAGYRVRHESRHDVSQAGEEWPAALAAVLLHGAQGPGAIAELPSPAGRSPDDRFAWVLA